ncbi:unnamed protein product [Rhizophagus irregularis]|nr:unnamed protein product [Rhizophagus irregularis]
MSSIHSIHSEHSDLNDDNSIILETRLSDIQIREYDETLKLLADDHSLAYNYALEETIRLMDNLVGCPKEDIEDKIVVNFAFKAAGHLSNYEWICYDNSTIAQLEFFLHAMSSVLHILSKSIKMIDSKTRATFYKSISKFWAIYRNTKIINSNIIFSLREIRNCLRKIKDDKSNADLAFKIGGNFFDVVVSVAQKEYLAAFGSFIKVLDFEYPAGEWYYDWIDRREKFFLLCSQNISESRSIRKFYRKLMKLSKKEFVRVKRKNTKYRKFEYKMLKSGGLIGGYSLPDNIETLLFGYLQLIQKLFEKFPLQLNKYLKDLISFCNEIVETHVKKQLTFKAIEILYFIKESTENVEIKNEIELSFETWSSYHVPPPTPPVRSLSAPPSFHYASSQNKPNDIITSSPNGEPFQYNMPPDTPVSAYTSFSSPPQSIYNPASNTPTRTLTPLSQEEKISLSKEEKTPLSQEEKSKKRRRISVREIPTKVTRSLSSLKQQCTRKRIIDDVKRLFAERLKIKKDIEHTKKHYNELLVNTKDEDKAIDKNSDNFSDSILAKLNEILEEKRKEASSPSLPQIPFVSEPEPIIYNNYEIKNIYNTPETREIIIYKYIESDNNAKITNKDVNNFEIKEESKKIEESCDKNTREINVHKENDNNEEVINKNINKPKDDVESSAETVLTKEISEVEMNPDKSVDNTKEEEDEIELSFETWSSYHVPPPTPPVRSLSAPPSFHYASSQNKPNDIITSSPNGEPFQYNMPPDTPVSAYTSFSSPPQSIYNPASNTPTRTLTPLSQEEKISLSKEEKTPLSQEEKSKKRRRISVREIPTKVTRSLSSLKQQCTRKRIIDDVKRLFAERLKIKKDIEHTKKHYNELLVNTKDEDKAIDKNSDNFSDSILAKLNEILEEKRKEASSPSLPQIPFVSEPEPIIYNNYEIKNIYNTPETREIIIYKYIESDNNAKITNKDVNNFEIKEESKKIEESCDKNTREINVHKENDNNEEVINKNINKPKDDVESSAETVLTKEISEVEMNPDKSVDNTKEEEDEVKPFETILTREINENEMNPHLKEVKSDNLEIEENEKKESNENNVDIQSINPSESHSEEEELKKDNNIDVEENEKEENDENHVVVENINSSESHSEEEEPKKDNNIDVEENKKEKNDENNVVVENINSSESHSEEQQLKKDEINMNVEENEKEECRKCDDGDSVHSVSEKVILPEIILTHSEDSVVKESNNPNIENIVTVNQVNQVNQINQINQINQYNIIQNVQNVNNVQQPQQPDDYEGSVFLKTVRKIVKEVENIVDKAAKAHREAVLRSSLYDNNSSLSVNEIKEDEEIIEEIVEKEEIIEKMVEKEEIIEKMVEKEEIIEKMVEKEEIIEKMVEKEKEEIIEKTIEKEEVALQI